MGISLASRMHRPKRPPPPSAREVSARVAIRYHAAMRWLVLGHTTAAVSEALKRHGHDARQAADIELSADASPEEVLKAAHAHQLDLLTADQTLANAPFGEDPFRFGRSIVYLNVGEGDVEQDDAVDRLFNRYKRLTPGRLYTVTSSRVKIRQLPGRA
ncbi:MAG: hypothetical protein JWO87_3205 [Phycisphaerales bacterium]|nr:hypothetical protein [Phycisphaerales bacterium]